MILFDVNSWGIKQAAPCFTGYCHASSSLSGGLRCCSVRNSCLLIIWLELKSPDPTFTFQVRYKHTQSKVQQFSLLNHDHTSAQPLLLQSFCSDNWTLFSQVQSISVSFFLSMFFFFLCWLTPLSSCLMLLCCMSKQHKLIFPAVSF